MKNVLNMPHPETGKSTGQTGARRSQNVVSQGEDVSDKKPGYKCGTRPCWISVRWKPSDSVLLQELLDFNGGHASTARRGDGLPVAAVLHIAAGEDAADSG